MTKKAWFKYLVKAQPHHTDYGGVVWHGTYLTWLETARVECLQSVGVNFADFVEMGCDLPVIEASLRYHLPITLGMNVVVKTRLVEQKGVRIIWDYEIKSPDDQELYLTAKVVLVAIDRKKSKIMRKLPPLFQEALAKIKKIPLT